MHSPLPIDAVLPDVLNALRSHGTVVFRAPTGAGKTTRLPPALVHSGLCNGTVYLLEPRRVAARAAARRMAFETGTKLGEEFGYHVRFDKKCNRQTKCLAVTPGILLRLLHDDPYLESVSTIVFDEFHERGLEADLALGFCKLIRDSVKPELKLVVMSATVDPGPVSRYLGDCPVVTSEGRSFPVEIRYRPKRPEQSWPEATATAIRNVLVEHDGDILAFLPGIREIRQTASLLEPCNDAMVLMLHGDLPPEQQDLALVKQDRRKIVLATNVAESSITVDGVSAVVDTGLARQLVTDPAMGMDRLVRVPISRASADQRAGRAGRTQPGVCIRLWDEVGHRSRPEQTEPEVARVDLAGPMLQLLSLGEADPATFPWLDAPQERAVQRAMDFLNRLGIIQDNRLTEDGALAARMPIHPRLARLLIAGHSLGVPERAALAAAILFDGDALERQSGPPMRIGPPTDSDLLDRVEALEMFARTGQTDTPIGRLNRGSTRFVLDSQQQLLRIDRDELGRSQSVSDPDEALLRAIFQAYPDRLAKRRGPNDRRAVTVEGRGVVLGPMSGVAEADLFVAIDVDAAGADAYVRMASAVRREWLEAEHLETRQELEYDERSDRLNARKRTRYHGLVLDDVPGHIADVVEADRAMADAARVYWDRASPMDDSPGGRMLARLRWLKFVMPDVDIPSFSEEQLQALLPEVCRGCRSLADVRNGPWLDAIRNTMTYQQWQLIEREAPTHIEVPSGSRIELTYEAGKPPVLAVRIQELFGVNDTPRLAGGRVPVLLHLLAPNYRPQQVTADLASFWKTGYPIVRKELRARYPKHSWPEDPLTAQAISGAKRRTDRS
jgi:ATP-dependent helicase HrpB